MDAGVEAVFAVLADAAGYARWVCGTREIHAADPGWPRVGARLWHRFGYWPLRSLGSTAVLACDPPHRLVLWVDVAPLALVRATLTVAERASGSVVCFREDMVAGPLLRFGALTAAVQRARNRVSLARLAALAVRRDWA